MCSEQSDIPLHGLASKSKLSEVFRGIKENVSLRYLAKSQTPISNVSTNSI
jgi:hypothetical protein